MSVEGAYQDAWNKSQRNKKCVGVAENGTGEARKPKVGEAFAEGLLPNTMSENEAAIAEAILKSEHNTSEPS